MDTESLLCIAITSELVHQNIFVILVMAFYCPFKTVNETLARQILILVRFSVFARLNAHQCK